MGTFEIYRLDEPEKTVAKYTGFSSPEAAMRAEKARRPEAILSLALLTLIDEAGAYGVRASAH